MPDAVTLRLIWADSRKSSEGRDDGRNTGEAG